jgi:hypothetical protein
MSSDDEWPETLVSQRQPQCKMINESHPSVVPALFANDVCNNQPVQSPNADQANGGQLIDNGCCLALRESW